jgi:hypothetical protein
MREVVCTSLFLIRTSSQIPCWIRNDQTFEEHVAQIIYFVNKCRDPNPVKVKAVADGFLLYVVGQSVHKMNRRINHKVHSTPTFYALLSLSCRRLVASFSYKFNTSDAAFLVMLHGHRGQRILRAIGRDLSTHQHHIPSESTHQRQIPPDSPEAMKERALEELSSLHQHKNADILFPYILGLNRETPQAIYNAETQNEFHLLLRLLLLGYHNSLKKLASLKKQSPPFPAKLFEYINTVCDYMSLLHPLAYSGAMVDHCHGLRIAHLTQTSVNMERELPTVVDDSAASSSEEDVDEDSGRGIQETSKLTDSQSAKMFSFGEPYTRWLQLQLIYVDAVSFIIKEVSQLPGDSSSAITIKVLCVPHSGKNMLDWRDVIEDVIYRVGLRDKNNLFSAINNVEAHESDVVKAIQAIDTEMRKDASFRRAMDHITPKQFKGREHCEACIAGLMFTSSDLFAKCGGKFDSALTEVRAFYSPACTSMTCI